MRRSIVLLAAFLGACSTPYAERPHTEAYVVGGTSLQPVGEDTYRIFSQGNVLTSVTQVRDHAIRRAAKQATERGFSGFYILEAQDQGTDFVVSFPAVELLVQLSNTPNAGYYRASDLYP